MRPNTAHIVETALASAGIMITHAERLALDARLAADGAPDDTGQRRSQSVVTPDAPEKAEALREALDAKRKKYGKDAKLSEEEEAACFDKARDKKAKKAKDNLPDPDDHRKDFNTISGNGAKDSARTFEQARDAAFRGSHDDYSTCVIRSQFGYSFPTSRDAVIDTMFGVRRPHESRSDGAGRESALAMDSGDLLDLDSMFASPGPGES